jgi:hypothetical protein
VRILKGKIHIIAAGGTVRTQTVEKKPELKSLQELVGGYFEVVPSSLYGQTGDSDNPGRGSFFKLFELSCGRAVVLVNEEGRIQNLPLNDYAMELLGTIPGPYGELYGDVVVLNKNLF